jgi:hypothetical protein
MNKGHGGGRNVKVTTLKGPGTLPETSALIGGVSNRTTNPSAKKTSKTGHFNKGGRAK